MSIPADAVEVIEGDAPAPAAERSVRSRAMRGSAWTLIGFGGGMVLRLSSTIILSRLLFPRAFGISALLTLFMQGLVMFSDVGLAQSIIRDPKGDDPDFLDTAWSISVARGVLLWLASVLIAVPVASFYETAQLAYLLPVAGFMAVLEGLNSTAWHTGIRHLKLGPVTWANLIHQAATLVITAALAFAMRSVWALVLGGLAGYLIKCILSHVMLGGQRHRFRWDRESAHRQLHFGKWIFLSSMVSFLAMQADRLLVGKLASLEQLGVYSMAVMLALVPRDLIFRLRDAVALPIVSRVIHAEGARDGRVAATRLALLGTAALMCVGLWAGRAPLVGLMFDKRYAGAVALLAVLVPGIWVQALWGSYYMVILAAGRPRAQAWGMCLRLALIVALVGPAYRRFGMMGIGGLTAIGDLGVLASCALGAARLGAVSWRLDLGATAAVVACGLALEVVSTRVVALTDSRLAGLAVIASALGLGAVGIAAVARPEGLARLLRRARGPVG